MAKNEWGDSPVQAEDPRSWGDRPAAQQDLPAGVQPSRAGAGRGTLGLADYASASRAAPAAAPVPDQALSLGGISPEFGGDPVVEGERVESVLQTQGMGNDAAQRRLALGAGPIRPEIAARADQALSGEDPGPQNRATVMRAARGLREQERQGKATTTGELTQRAQRADQLTATERRAEETRSVGQWAMDTTSALLSGGVSLIELPTNIIAPGSALAGKLGEWQQGLQELESPQMQARRELFAGRIRNEEGFVDQWATTVSEMLANPSVAIQETLRQVAMFGGVMAAAKGGQMAAQLGVRGAAHVSPAVAVADAISAGGVAARAGQVGATVGGLAASSTMAAGDAAGNTFKTLMDAPQRVWDASPDYQQLIAEGVDPLKAKEDIATAKARVAALMAAPLGLLGFMGAEASFAGRMADRAGRAPLRTVATELVTEPAEEALTQIAGNFATSTVNPEQSLTEGAGQAAGMATVTSGPFALAGGVNELRKPVDRSEQIKALRAGGDTMAAEMLQRRFDREMAAYSAGTEAERLRAAFGDATAERYRGIRAAGAKSGEAVVKTAIQGAAADAADQAGLSQKARTALVERLETVSPEQAPQVIQRFVENMAAAGAAQRFEGLDTLAQRTETQMEEMLDAVLDDSVRPTMDAVEALEGETKPAEGATPAPESATAAPPAETDFDAGNDVVVTPETEAVHAAATSPLNDLPEPTDAQKEAGNYKLGRLRMAGMDISVENPQGSVRRGTSPDGTAWETPMRDHYGYIRRTTAADGDKLDLFIKPGTPADFDGTVFVVDQVDPATGKFDEAKVVMGAADQAEAEQIYRRNYSEGWQGLGAITAMPMAEFKSWAMSDRARAPLAALPEQTPAPAESAAARERFGRDGVPIKQGGVPFKTRAEADKARRLQSGTRVVKEGKGFALIEKTEAQRAAEERAAQRLRGADTGAGPVSAHGHIAARGGMAKSTMADLGFDRNVRVGNRWLFAATGGMSLDQAAQSLKQAGYIQAEDEGAAAAVIARSVRTPVYTAEGVEAMAEQEAQRQFEEHLQAQQEADDPFGPIEDFDDDELQASGYAAASDEIKAEVAALLAQAEAQGLDTEDLREDAARATQDQPEQAYYEQVQSALADALAPRGGSGSDAASGRDGQGQLDQAERAGREDRGEADGQPREPAGVDTPLLSAPSREEVLEQQDRQAQAGARDEREQIRRESEAGAEQFTLTSEDGRQDSTGSLFDPAPSPAAPTTAETIQDLGEKVGGARKDTAQPAGSRSAKRQQDERPAWARRFQISQLVSGIGEDGLHTGRWVINDTRSLDWSKQPKRVGRETYATREDAEAAVPLAAVALKHRAVATREGKYEIWRDVTDRKRVKVVDRLFDSREDAMRYMAENAVAIIETNTTFGEADLPVPENKARSGPERRKGDVKGADFMQAFGFRGVEFGNWNNQEERQVVMNEAYDGLLDLAEAMGIPPRAISLGGQLALAFGARGQGLSGARAHYETDRSVINLTKLNGAGALAHEWWHAVDHYFARQDGKASAEWEVLKDGTRKLKVIGDAARDLASGGFSRGERSGVREELRQAFDAVMSTMSRKAEQYQEDTERVDRFVAQTRKDVQDQIADVRRYLEQQLDPKYYKRNNKPASAEQLAEFDTLAQQIIDGSALATTMRSIEGGKARFGTYRDTNDQLERLGAIYKAVRGRSGFNAERTGTLDRLGGAMRRYRQRLEMLEQARQGQQKTRMVPTQFAMDARALDQGRGQDYWTTPAEMSARAFQGFIEDRLAERGVRSPFLNHAPENAVLITPWGFNRPYPAGEERRAINAAFAKFVDEIRTREEADGNVVMYARAYHGTPHRGIERFTTDAIGTGEGAQAYGWGLYFASKPEVAEFYRKGLSYRDIVREFREEMPDDADFDEVLDAADDMSPHRARVIRALAAEDWLGFDYPAQAITAAFRDLDNYDVSQELQDAVRAAQGQLYQVSVPDDGDLLLWDKPLSEQPASVRAAIERIAREEPAESLVARSVRDGRTGEVIYRALSRERDSDRAASESLLAAGVKGLKYLDGGSRRAGEGSHNYVIFSDDDVAVEAALYKRDGSDGSAVITADLYRRMTTPQRAGMTVEDVSAAVDPVVKGWPSGPKVLVMDGASDLPFAAPSDAAGAYFQGTIYLVASRIRTAEQAMRFLGHEAIAHYGLREMLGREGWRTFMNQVQLALASGNTELRKLQADVRRAYADADGGFSLSPAIEADEIAARAVELAVGADGKFRPGFGFFKAVYARIVQFLRERLGLKVAFTNTELQGALVNAQRFLEAGQRSASARAASQPVWARGDAVRVPQVVIGSNLGAATSHPQYPAAKAGDVAAAVEVAQALVTPELVDQVRAEIGGAQPLVVGVVSEEAAGRNKIPLAAAEVLAQRLGLATATGIVQANRARRTNLDGLDRIFAGPEFTGPVVAGQDYVILDDTLTQGATFAALAAHIEAGGGRVVAAVALTGKRYSAKMQPSPETIKALRDKHGDLEEAFRAATGYGFDALTESEARYLANFKPADAVRDRILAEGRRRGEQPDQGPDQGLSDDGPVFARSPALRAPAPGPATPPAAQPGAAAAPPSAGPAPQAPAPSFWDAPAETRGDRIIYELQDGRVDLKRVQQAIVATRGPIDERFDARLAETLYPGRVARRSQRFLEQEAQPLLEVMARNNVGMDELSDYLHARHARERNEQIAKVNPGMPDGGAGKNSKGVLMTTAAAKAHLDAISPLRRVLLDSLGARVDAITAGTRRLLVDEGLEKAEAVKAWEDAYKAYVPLFRDEAEGGNPHHAGTGISVRGSASRRATGSTRKATNILAHVLMQREAAITRAEKNRVGVALYGLALQAPNPDFWATIRPGMSDAQIGAELQRLGVPAAALGNMERAPTIRTVDPVLGRVVERPNPLYKSLPGAIVVKVNGNDRVLMLDVNDPRGARLAENLKNLDGLTRLDIAGSVVGKATRWLAAVNTQYNPAFGLVNFVRDSLGGAINITSTALRGKTTKVLAMTPAAVAGIARELAGRPSGPWGALWRQFQADGGQTGYREMFKDADARTKAIEAELKSLEKTGKLRGDRVVHVILGALDVFNTTLENAVRLAAYREALNAGLSRAEAARLGRELTVDFNRKGRTGREVSPLYAFFNASVQGQARTLQTLAGPAGAKIIAGGLLLGVGQALLLLLAGYDDDDLPEFVKSRALIVPLGESEKGEKKYFALPMPLGLHVLPNTGRVLAELTLSGGQDLAGKAFDAVGEIAGSFNPLGGGNIFEADGALRTIAPSLVDPLIELAANKNFAGVPIEREPAGENDPRPGFQRARESTMRSATGQTYLEISRILNTLTGGDAYEAGLVSPTPERVRYLLQVLGGGLQREAEKIVNTAVDVSKGAEVKARGVPVFGRFFGEVDDDLVQRTRYFDNVREIERAERRAKAAAKTGDADAVRAIHEKEPLAALSESLDITQKALTKLNKSAVQTLDDGEMTKSIDEARFTRMRILNEQADQKRRDARGPTPGERLREALRPAP